MEDAHSAMSVEARPCYACREQMTATEYETRFGRKLWLCSLCVNRFDLGPVVEVKRGR